MAINFSEKYPLNNIYYLTDSGQYLKVKQKCDSKSLFWKRMESFESTQ